MTRSTKVTNKFKVIDGKRHELKVGLEQWEGMLKDSGGNAYFYNRTYDVHQTVTDKLSMLCELETLIELEDKIEDLLTRGFDSRRVRFASALIASRRRTIECKAGIDLIGC